MREFMEDLGKKLGETAESVTAKAGEYIEVQKIKNQIRALERSNDRDFVDIGKMTYDKFQAGEEVSEEVKSLCEAIHQREEEIAACERQAADTRGAVACPTCKKNVEKGMLFCPYCGEKVPVDAWKSEMKDKAKEAADKAMDKAENLAETLKNKAESFADDTASMMDEASEKVEDIFEEEEPVVVADVDTTDDDTDAADAEESSQVGTENADAADDSQKA